MSECIIISSLAAAIAFAALSVTCFSAVYKTFCIVSFKKEYAQSALPIVASFVMAILLIVGVLCMLQLIAYALKWIVPLIPCIQVV